MKSTRFQNTFLKGEIADTLDTRIDTNLYQQALKRAKNVELIPHGGVRRRRGTFLTDISFSEEVRLDSFLFSDEQSYLTVFTVDTIYFYSDDTLVDSVDINALLTRDLTSIELKQLDIIQSADTMLCFHQNIKPMKITRSGTTFTLSYISFENIPQFDFTSNTAGFIEYFKGDGTTTDFILIYTVPFFSVYVNGTKTTAYTYDTGVGKIVFTSAPANNADIRVISGSALTAFNQDVPYEDVWSTSKGYPSCATFHQGRLWMAGTNYKPTSIWGSVINEQFNFKLGSGANDDSVFDTIQSNDYNGIVRIVSGRALQVFTESAEFINSSQLITPTDSAWVRQSSYGSKRIRPVILDGATFFSDKSKKNVMQYIYSFDEDGYLSRPITLLSSHLFSEIVTMDTSIGADDEISSLLYVLDNNGKLNVLNTMRTEEISGWVQFESAGGTFKGLSVVSNIVYVAVYREDTYYIEKLSSDTTMDFTTSVTSANRIEVKRLDFVYDVVADGYYMGEKTPYDDGGTYYVDIGRTATTAQAGLGFSVELQTLALNSATNAGFNLNDKKRVVKVILNLYESVGVQVAGEVLGDRIFPVTLNSPSTPFTGLKEIYLLGWDRLTYLDITQDVPLTFTLLGLEAELSSS